MADFKAIGDEMMRVLDATCYDDLYDTLNFSVLRKHLKHRFKTLFNCQTLTFIRACYPDWECCSWKFKSPLKNQWNDISNCRFAIDYIAKQEGWKSRTEYHKINGILIAKYIGLGLSDRYSGKIWKMMMEIYPPVDPSNKMADDYWYPWMMGGPQNGDEEGRKRCRSTPKDTFTETENRRWYVEWLCTRLQMNIPEDLPKLTQKHFIDNFGKGMLVKYYNTSVYKCLHDLFPEFSSSHMEWYMFTQKPKNSFNNNEERIRAMKYVRQQLGLNAPEDFYDLSVNDFAELNLGGLIYHSSQKGTGFAKIIQELNPDLVFDLTRFNRHKTENMVVKYFRKRGYTIDTQYIIYKTEYNTYFYLDIIFPELDLVIEIDGDQHFKGRLAFFQKIGHELILKRDIFKMQKANSKGLSIIRISQTECWNGRESWITNNLLPLIKSYEAPTNFFITTTPEFDNVYSEHKAGLLTELIEDDISF